MNVKKISWMIGLFSLVISFSAYAFQYSFKDSRFVLQAGMFEAWQGSAQNINIAGFVSDRFTIKRHYDDNYLLGVGYFIPTMNCDQYRLMLGVNAFYLAKTQVKGSVIQENIFNNLAYQYNITHYPLYLDAKLLTNILGKNDITLDVGAGPNFFHTNHFYETSLDGGITIPDYIFYGRTRAVFSATAGVGILFNHVLGCIPLELSYRFFYLGHNTLSTHTDQVLNKLKTDNSYANALMLSVYF